MWHMDPAVRKGASVSLTRKNPGPGHGKKAETVEEIAESVQDWQDHSEFILPEAKDPQQTCPPSYLL